MEIVSIQNLEKNLLDYFLSEEKGEKSIASKLASSQTGNDRTVTKERMEYVLNSFDHVMFFCIEGKELLGMILGQRVTGINNSYMYIHDVVVNTETRGIGVGSKLMEVLMSEGYKKWPEIVRMQLTSRPSRGTGPFFKKFGFTPRTKEFGDETIVYVKTLGDYTS